MLVGGHADSDASARDRVVREVLQQLPQARRELIELAFFEGYSHEEIAAKQAIPVGTVKTRIRTGLMAMRKTLVTALGAPARPAAASGSQPLLAARATNARTGFAAVRGLWVCSPGAGRRLRRC